MKRGGGGWKKPTDPVCDDSKERAGTALHVQELMLGRTVHGVELVTPALEDGECSSGAPRGEGCSDVSAALEGVCAGEGDGVVGEGPVGAGERGVFEGGDDGGEEVAEYVGAVGEWCECAEAFGVQCGVSGCVGEAVRGVSR